MWYHVSRPHEYLVITGAGIKDVLIKKTAFVMPLQRVTRISITPFDFSLDLQAMTLEKLQFALPAVFTIGPDNELESLTKYALLLSAEAEKSGQSLSGVTASGHVQDIVTGIIEGETRVIVSTMTMEEIFKEREIFKQKVIDNVQHELKQFGLRIYNANVKELQDAPGSEYFTFLSMKAHEGAQNQAKISRAEARMHGDIGEAEKQGQSRREISRIEAETAVQETQRRSDKAQADAQLTNRQTELDMGIRMKKIDAERQAETRDAELHKEVEMKRAETELERLRAKDVTRSKVEKESAQQAADANYYTQTTSADGKMYQQKMDADGDYYRQSKIADTNLLAKQKEAQAIMEMANAEFVKTQKEAEGLKEMANAYGALADVLGGPQALLQYLMLQNNTYQKLADSNARAINGLQPKITVWNTGNGDGASQDNTAPIRNIMQSLPPLFSTIQDQTGISPPGWMAQMPQNQQNSMSNTVDGDLVKPKGFKPNANANANTNSTTS